MTFQSIEAVCRAMDEIAPPQLREDYDNVGLLAGRMDAPVEGIYVALDLTADVLRRAMEKDCQLIVTHHPILFHGRKNLREDDPEGALMCSLIRSGLALFAAHTNFDNAPHGMGEWLAKGLKLSEAEPWGEGLYAGMLPREMGPDALWRHVKECLGGVPRIYGGKERMRKAALCPGAGGFMASRAGNADVFITGEIKHHEILEALQRGLCVVDAGHRETEQFAINAFAEGLQTALDALQWKNMRIYKDPCKEEAHAD